MELLRQVSNPQFLFTAAAVTVVLICAALVFIFGFHSAEQPQFDKLPLIIDDKKSSNKKRKLKEKKSSPNRTATEDTKTKDSSKKSPIKEKKEDKVKESEKLKPKEKSEPKIAKKELFVEVKKGKKSKHLVEVEKPVDFDDAGWQEVPKKSDKKKVKGPEEKEKRESPIKKNKKKGKDVDVEATKPPEDSSEETIKVLSAEGPGVDEEATRALQAQVEELQRVLKEAERRELAALTGAEDDDAPAIEDFNDAKDLRSNKKKENKEKQNKKKANEAVSVAKHAPKVESLDDITDLAENQNDKENAPVFDQLGDTWTEAKVPKKGKKKVRKDQ